MTTARFSFGSNPATSVDEAAASPEALLPATDEWDMTGAVTLTNDGATPVILTDDLEFLVPNLCLRAPAVLASADTVSFGMASRPVRIVLVREGAAMSVRDGDGAELGRFPDAALMAALQGCAKRFTDFVGRMAALDRELAPLHAMLERELAAPVPL